MDVFLSWSGNVAKIAASAFHDWLDHAFRGKRIKVYFSSKSNDPGALWREALRGALARSSVGVFFLTRASISSPWVLFEGGAVGKLKRSCVFTILIDLDHRDLAAAAPPFEEYQAVSFSKDDLWRVVIAIISRARIATVAKDRLRASFDTWWSRLKKNVDRTLGTGLTSAGDWHLVSAANVASRINGSPYELKHLFRVAKSRVDLVAQNHHFIAVEQEDEHFDLLRRFLSQPKRVVRILAMNPRKKAAVRTWTELMGTRDFPKDLRSALANLRKWKRIASKEKWKGKLDIRVTGLIPTSQTFVDGESENGRLVVVPMGRKPSNTDRAALLLSRSQNREAFDGYWTTYIEHYRRARPL